MTNEEIKRICQIYDNLRRERDAATIAYNSDDTFYEHVLATYNLLYKPSPNETLPETDEEEITDSIRACCNCISGATRYPDCYCWLHEDCNTDEPYRIPKEDWVETATKCKEFEFEHKRDIR